MINNNNNAIQREYKLEWDVFNPNGLHTWGWETQATRINLHQLNLLPKPASFSSLVDIVFQLPQKKLSVAGEIKDFERYT